MITTDFVTGSPCWFDLRTTDMGSSIDFYKRVFGWEAESTGARTGDYMILRSEGAAVGGVGPQADEDEPPNWGVYFWVTDIEEVTRRAVKLGATLLLEPTEVFELGWMAYLADPQGGAFSLWQAGTFLSVGAVDRPNTLCWLELSTPSAQKAGEFYGGLFGWEFEDLALPGGEGLHSTVRPAGLGGDRYFGGLMDRAQDQLPRAGDRAAWHPVFQVTDCDRSAEVVRGGGGRVHYGPEDEPGVGRLAVCSDPYSAGFVLLDPVAGGI